MGISVEAAHRDHIGSLKSRIRARALPTETAPAPGQEQQSRIPRRGAFRDVAIAALIGLVALVVYNANLRSIPAADTYAARYLPFSILRDHKVVLDSIVREVAQGRKPPEAPGQVETAAWMLKGPGGRLVSLYPVAVPVVVAPLYLPAVHFLSARGWEPLLFDKVARVMEKLSASLMAAGSVMLFYLCLLYTSPSPRDS